jgi:ABC-2 type transport system permease protein
VRAAGRAGHHGGGAVRRFPPAFHFRISQERKDGWIRQLRLTSLPANAYVLAKVIASMVTTVPSVVIVLALGRCYGGVHLARQGLSGPAGRWSGPWLWPGLLWPARPAT